MSADEINTKLANTTIANGESTSTGAGGHPINFEQNEKAKASALEGRRLYIGNLAYATNEGGLKDFFKAYAVETVSVPTNPRTSRPVGYAFLDVSTSDEAQKAIAEMNGKELESRKISVQLARNPSEAHEGEDGVNRRESGRGRGRGGRGRGGRRAGDHKTDAEGQPVNGSTETAGEQEKKREPRQARKQRGPTEDGVPSKTKVMVANLPYDIKEEKLLEIFAEYKPSAAKIALRPIPKFMIRKLLERNEPRKGRGFGFVTLASEELQQKACADMNGKEIEGREIAVKVAIDSPGKEDQEGGRAAAKPADTTDAAASPVAA